MLAAPLWGRLNDRGEPRRYFTFAAMGCALSGGLLILIDQIWIVALLRITPGCLLRGVDAVGIAGLQPPVTHLGIWLCDGIKQELHGCRPADGPVTHFTPAAVSFPPLILSGLLPCCSSRAGYWFLAVVLLIFHLRS